MNKAVPFGAEFVRCTDDPREAGVRGRENVGDLVERLFKVVLGGLSQRITSISRRVSDVKNHVADGVVIELPERLGQLEPPATDHSASFEREEALVSEA